MHSEDPRAALQRLADERRTSLSALSRMIRRNPAYLQQFIKRGSPAHLNEGDRALLAAFFRVDEELLGGPAKERVSPSKFASVPVLTVRASAGPGALVDGEVPVAHFGFDRNWLKTVSQARAEDLSIIRVSGDSMSPTLTDGDDILVDRSDGADRLRDGIYVLTRDDTLMVKRLSLHPAGHSLTIASDNPAYPTWHDCAPDAVRVIGRVVWSGRRL